MNRMAVSVGEDCHNEKSLRLLHLRRLLSLRIISFFLAEKRNAKKKSLRGLSQQQILGQQSVPARVLLMRFFVQCNFRKWRNKLNRQQESSLNRVFFLSCKVHSRRDFILFPRTKINQIAPAPAMCPKSV